MSWQVVNWKKSPLRLVTIPPALLFYRPYYSTGLTIPPALLFHRPYYSTGLLRSSMMRFLLMAQVLNMYVSQHGCMSVRGDVNRYVCCDSRFLKRRVKLKVVRGTRPPEAWPEREMHWK
jgi:hypothetical protein